MLRVECRHDGRQRGHPNLDVADAFGSHDITVRLCGAWVAEADNGREIVYLMEAEEGRLEFDEVFVIDAIAGSTDRSEARCPSSASGGHTASSTTPGMPSGSASGG